MKKTWLLLLGAIFFWASCKDNISIKPEDDFDLSEHEVRNFSSPMLSTYDSCESLNAALKKSALEKMRTEFAMQLKNVPSRGGYQKGDLAVPVSAAPGSMPEASVGAAVDAKGMQEGVDFSGTNNQEQGVDEADIIKIDGKHFYILNKSTLEIVAIPEVGKLAHKSNIKLAKPGKALLISDDKAFIFSDERLPLADEQPNDARLLSIAPYPMGPSEIRLDIVHLNAERNEARILENIYFQGELMGARKIGKKIHIAAYMDESLPGLVSYPELDAGFYRETDEQRRKALWRDGIRKTVRKNEQMLNNYNFLKLMPTTLTKKGNKFERKPVENADCAQTFGAKDDSATGFLSLITIDPETSPSTIEIQHVRGNRPIVYASPDQFILASAEHEPWWFFNSEELNDQTTIHRFAMDERGIPDYKDSVRVPGSLHNSFSLSEYQGYVRVATTTKPRDRFWLDSPGNRNARDENHLFILGEKDGAFDIVSSIEGLAPGEKIWSARFSKDKGFLVTFRQVDPLFTLDLKDPLHPKVAGQLKIPGVSTYLQDIGNDKLLSVGYGGNGDGLDFQTNISLFDTSDFSKPSLFDRLSFFIEEGLDASWARVSSEANQTHLAVNYFAPVAMTAIPLSTYRHVENPLDPLGWTFEYISKLTLVKTAPDQKLSVYGEVSHSQFYNDDHSYYHHEPSIRRSYFVGDYIYAVSPKAITATRLSDMTTTGTYELP